jgi:hypothetical protein
MPTKIRLDYRATLYKCGCFTHEAYAECFGITPCGNPECEILLAILKHNKNSRRFYMRRPDVLAREVLAK